MTDGSGLTTWTCDKMGRYLSEARTINGVQKTISTVYNPDGYGYDPAGNLLNDGISHSCGTNGYAWTADEMESCANGTTNLSGTITSEYLLFGGKRIARRDISGGSVYYYFSDMLGSSNVITSATGSVLNESDYYPYGGESVVTDTISNHYKFTGKERDSESGNDYFGARYFTSSMGRMLSPDPLGGSLANPQSLNKYAYALNNPLTNTDPTGLYACRRCSRCNGTLHISE